MIGNRFYSLGERQLWVLRPPTRSDDDFRAKTLHFRPKLAHLRSKLDFFTLLSRWYARVRWTATTRCGPTPPLLSRMCPGNRWCTADLTIWVGLSRNFSILVDFGRFWVDFVLTHPPLWSYMEYARVGGVGPDVTKNGPQGAQAPPEAPQSAWKWVRRVGRCVGMRGLWLKTKKRSFWAFLAVVAILYIKRPKCLI